MPITHRHHCWSVISTNYETNLCICTQVYVQNISRNYIACHKLYNVHERIIIHEPKIDFTGLPSTILAHSSHSNPEI